MNSASAPSSLIPRRGWRQVVDTPTLPSLTGAGQDGGCVKFTKEDLDAIHPREFQIQQDDFGRLFDPA